jgi:hypothetical protein
MKLCIMLVEDAYSYLILQVSLFLLSTLFHYSLRSIGDHQMHKVGFRSLVRLMMANLAETYIEIKQKDGLKYTEVQRDSKV